MEKGKEVRDVGVEDASYSRENYDRAWDAIYSHCPACSDDHVRDTAQAFQKIARSKRHVGFHTLTFTFACTLTPTLSAASVILCSPDGNLQEIECCRRIYSNYNIKLSSESAQLY